MPAAIRNPWFEMDQVAGVTIVTFTAAEVVQPDAIEAVSQQLLKLIEYFSSRRLVLNLASVRRLSSLMLGKLIGLNARVSAAGGQMVLCHLTPEVMEVLKVVKMLQTFRICTTEEEAIRSF
jgi:anti-sigma B factor antagonist